MKALLGLLLYAAAFVAVMVGLALIDDTVTRATMQLAQSRQQATWVSEPHDGGISKSGRVWSQHEWTAAMKGTSELGRWKRVSLADQPHRFVYVLVTDRLPDRARSDIDLSKSATLLLGGEDLILRGRFDVTIEDAP